MLSRAGVEVILGSAEPVPLLDADGRLLGARAGDRTLLAKQVIDGQADGRFAAAAGAPFTLGWESLGVKQRMADTLVFALHGVDWPALTRAVQARGAAYAEVRDNVVWGPFGGYPAAYVPSRSGLRLRGLNLGRESDGTVLVNALLLFGDDPLDPASRADARRRAAAEVPSVVRYLAAGIPGLRERPPERGGSEAVRPGVAPPRGAVRVARRRRAGQPRHRPGRGGGRLPARRPEPHRARQRLRLRHARGVRGAVVHERAALARAAVGGGQDGRVRPHRVRQRPRGAVRDGPGRGRRGGRRPRGRARPRSLEAGGRPCPGAGGARHAARPRRLPPHGASRAPRSDRSRARTTTPTGSCSAAAWPSAATTTILTSPGPLPS